jgi:hypothetical protein
VLEHVAPFLDYVEQYGLERTIVHAEPLVDDEEVIKLVDVVVDVLVGVDLRQLIRIRFMKK